MYNFNVYRKGSSVLCVRSGASTVIPKGFRSVGSAPESAVNAIIGTPDSLNLLVCDVAPVDDDEEPG